MLQQARGRGREEQSHCHPPLRAVNLQLAWTRGRVTPGQVVQVRRWRILSNLFTFHVSAAVHVQAIGNCNTEP